MVARQLAGLALCAALGASFAALLPEATGQTPMIGNAVAIDGDTIRLGNQRVRLFGIDAPEAHQTCLDASGRPWACGEAATVALRKMLAEGGVTCAAKDHDRYGRTVATCNVAYREEVCDPARSTWNLPAASCYVVRDLGARMVALGLAVDRPKYSHGAYQDQQQAAKAEHLGIWAGTFTGPADWRREHGH